MANTEQIKQLRSQTGVSIAQCKKAIDEAKGDMDKALDFLKKKSKDIAVKKSERSLGSGAVHSYIHAGGSVGAIVEVACETDFVARNEDFQKLAYDIAMHIAAMNPEFLSTNEITDEMHAKAKELFIEEVELSKKPKDIKEKMMEGKLTAYFKERTLLEQSFVKNPDLTISSMVDEAVQKFGEKINIIRFTRFAVGV